jgi:hypothetical protein
MNRGFRRVALSLFVLAIALAQSFADPPRTADRFRVHVLVSDGSVAADHIDGDLVNPWGIAFNPNGPVWVADNHSGLSTLYDGAGVKNALVVTVPPPSDGSPPSAPTGIVFAGGADFVVDNGTLSGPARFIFASEDGTISAWAPNVNPTNAILEVEHLAKRPSLLDWRSRATGARTACTRRLPQQQDRRVRRSLPAHDGSGRLPRLLHPAPLRPLRHPEHPGQSVRHLRQAGRRRRGRPAG